MTSSFLFFSSAHRAGIASRAFRHMLADEEEIPFQGILSASSRQFGHSVSGGVPSIPDGMLDGKVLCQEIGKIRSYLQDASVWKSNSCDSRTRTREKDPTWGTRAGVICLATIFSGCAWAGYTVNDGCAPPQAVQKGTF